MPIYNASQIADRILFAADKRGISVTNLKLQKLIYYAQAWHLAIWDEPLFDDRIEAWIHGPVVPPVFGRFKQYRWNPIAVANAESGDVDEEYIREHIEEVLEAYGNLTGPQLETLTHQEDPWKIARNGIPPDSPSNAIISHESMKDYYGPQVAKIA